MSFPPGFVTNANFSMQDSSCQSLEDKNHPIWLIIWGMGSKQTIPEVMGPVLLDIGLGSPMFPGGILYSESLESGLISYCWWGGAMCISKFLWTTQVYPSPLPGFNNV